MDDLVLVRGEFLTGLMKKHRERSKIYRALLKKVTHEELVKALIRHGYLVYGGAFDTPDEYPAYLAVEDWVDRKLDDTSHKGLGDVMEEISMLSLAVEEHLDEVVSQITSRYTTTNIYLVGYDSGSFVVKRSMS